MIFPEYKKISFVLVNGNMLKSTITIIGIHCSILLRIPKKLGVSSVCQLALRSVFQGVPVVKTRYFPHRKSHLAAVPSLVLISFLYSYDIQFSWSGIYLLI
jgi:hypothetical protein